MKHKAGDIVRVRDWDDMERQYGTDSDGNIHLPDEWWFNNSMKPFCGKDYKISGVFSESYGLENTGGYNFTDDMLLPAGTGKDKVMKIDLCEIFGVKPDQVFHIKGKNFLFEDEYRVHEKVLQFHSMSVLWKPSARDINEFHDSEVVLYSATEDEKTILRNLDKKHRKKGNIYRLATGELRIVVRTGCYEDFCFPYSDLFQFIQPESGEVPIKDIIRE